MTINSATLKEAASSQPIPPNFVTKLGQHSNVLALVFFLITSIIQTYPLIFNLHGYLDTTDPVDSAWRIGSIAQNLLNNPLQLYQTNALYPIPNGLALDELLTGNAILAAPLIWLTNDPVLALNLLILAGYVLSGFAMFLLVRKLTGKVEAGLVAGAIFAFSPWHMGQIGHVGVAAQQWMIFALYFLSLFLEKPPLKVRALLYLAAFVLLFALQILAGGYHAYFAAILFFLYLSYYFGFSSGILGWLLAKIGRAKAPSDPRPQTATITKALNWKKIGLQIGLLLVAAVAVLGLVLPFVLAFIEAQKAYGFRRDLNSDVYYWSATPESLLRTNTQSWLYRPIQRDFFKWKTSPERMLYPGITAVILAIVGLVMGGKLGGKRWLFGFMAVLGFVLALGPYLKPDEFNKNPNVSFKLPYYYLYNLIPGFDALRVPLRFGQLMMLGLAVGAGFGVAAITTRKPTVIRQGWKRFTPLLITLLCLGLVAVDYYIPTWEQREGTFRCNLEARQEFECTSARIGDEALPLYRWLAQDTQSLILMPKDALLVEVPVNLNPIINSNPAYMLQSLFHKRPMLNGSANILPTGFNQLYNELEAVPSDRTLDVMEGLGVKFLLVHRVALNPTAQAALDKAIAEGKRLEVIKQFEQDFVIKLKPSERAALPKSLLPAGATIWLGETDRYKSLYLVAFAGLLGKDYRYFAPSQTVYSPLLNVKVGDPKQSYQFALLYQGANPAEFGYSATNLIWQNEVAQLYRR